MTTILKNANQVVRENCRKVIRSFGWASNLRLQRPMKMKCYIAVYITHQISYAISRNINVCPVTGFFSFIVVKCKTNKMEMLMYKCQLNVGGYSCDLTHGSGFSTVASSISV